MDIENVREDFICECTIIQVREVESLLKEDKIVEMVVWSLSKQDGAKKENCNEQIEVFLREFADVFSTKLRQL